MLVKILKHVFGQQLYVKYDKLAKTLVVAPLQESQVTGEL
jgi:hypothetical protein